MYLLNNMSAKYILRLDDACPTMDVVKWDRIEKICNKFLIRPIMMRLIFRLIFFIMFMFIGAGEGN